MTEQTIEKTPMPNGLAKETSILIDMLKDGKPGDTITDEAMFDHCGKQTCSSGSGYGNLETAKKYVLTNNGVVWYRVRGAGVIKCADAKEIGMDSKQTLKAIARRSKRGLKKIATVDLADVEDSDKSEFLAMSATLGTVAMFSKTSTQKKLSARCVEKPLELTTVIDMFRTYPE